MSTTTQSPASTRIESLLDANSFVEIGQGVLSRSTDFNASAQKAPSDGVITGYGVIDGNLVYVYSQDASCLGGTLGEMHAKKITRLYDMALKTGAPIIGLIDCGGLRLQEATDALEAFGAIYLKSNVASGIIPQVLGIFGNCGGGMAVLAGLSDFTFIEGKNGRMFVNAPNAIKGNKDDALSKAAFQAQTGLIDDCGSEEDVLAGIRSLIGFLPSNNEDNGSYDEVDDDLNRVCEDLPSCTGDTALALSRIADDEDFFEVKKGYGQDIAAGFLRLNGQTVGAVANRSAVYDEEGKAVFEGDGTLSPEGARKAARFVRFCDAFNIPVLTLTNVTGFLATSCSEKRMASALGEMVSAFAGATVPKVNVILEKAYGSAYTVMNSKALGADMVYAWENAEIGMMDSDLAAKILFPQADAAALKEKAAEYKALQSGAASAAARGYVDTVISPADTRKYVIGAFEMLYTKREDRPAKKHGSV